MTSQPLERPPHQNVRGERVFGATGLDEIIVGKDILELISSAMYVDPLTIYREYIQNAADSIDLARRQELLTGEQADRVDIFIDQGTRTVRIRDNGCGVARQDFARRLTAIGASAKRGTDARGFRGVGRLAGLGYAQEVVFRSRTEGYPEVLELRWDCRKLRASLRSSDNKLEIEELIRNVVSLNEINGDRYPGRFFEVELKGIVRLKSDRLMSAVAIAEYLSQVAPVPFAPEFKFGAEINEALKTVVSLGELHLHIEGIERPVFRPHRDKFVDDHGRSIEFDSVEFFEIPAIEGETAGIAWILHHEYEGAVPNTALFKGLRLRSGNVQIGEPTLLEELFSEPRFNSWSVGEIHVLDKRIVPNGRRDHFEQNAHFHNLINHLGPLVREIGRRCRTYSIRRKLLRELDLHKETVAHAIGVIGQGSVGRAERKRLALSAEQTLLQMERIAAKDLFSADGDDVANVSTTTLKDKLSEVMNDGPSSTSPLSRLPRSQRKIYERCFELIYKLSTNRSAAKALVDKIMIEL
jgi:hypothetical protein